jgi:hypothetical protein
MQNNKSLSVILILVFTSLTIHSQVNEKARYTIISFEMNRSKDPKGTQKFYWITPTDSIKNEDFYLYPLILDKYSKDNLDMCCERNTIDIFTITTSTSYNFNEGYEAEVNLLFSLMDSKKTMVQKIKMEWDKGYKEDVKVYATPVLGEFCNCIESHKTGNQIDFNGLVYIPLSDFSFDYSFWKSEKSKNIKCANYSSVDFSSYLILYGRSVRTKIE